MMLQGVWLKYINVSKPKITEFDRENEVNDCKNNVEKFEQVDECLHLFTKSEKRDVWLK